MRRITKTAKIKKVTLLVSMHNDYWRYGDVC